MISQNPDMLYQLLGVEADELGEGFIPPNAHVVSLSQPEMEAVQRVCGSILIRNPQLIVFLVGEPGIQPAGGFAGLPDMRQERRFGGELSVRQPR